MASVDKFTPFDLGGRKIRRCKHWIPIIGIWLFIKDMRDMQDDFYVQVHGMYSGAQVVGVMYGIFLLIKSAL